jgi:hypothetical protein
MLGHLPAQALLRPRPQNVSPMRMQNMGLGMGMGRRPSPLQNMSMRVSSPHQRGKISLGMPQMGMTQMVMAQFGMPHMMTGMGKMARPKSALGRFQRPRSNSPYNNSSMQPPMHLTQLSMPFSRQSVPMVFTDRRGISTSRSPIRDTRKPHNRSTMPLPQAKDAWAGLIYRRDCDLSPITHSQFTSSHYNPNPEHLPRPQHGHMPQPAQSPRHRHLPQPSVSAIQGRPPFESGLARGPVQSRDWHSSWQQSRQTIAEDLRRLHGLDRSLIRGYENSSRMANRQRIDSSGLKIRSSQLFEGPVEESIITRDYPAYA